MTTAGETYRFYNQSEGYLERLDGAGWRPEYDAVLAALNNYQAQPHGRALDYGCGVGDLAASLARSGYQAYGADISLPFLQEARSRYPGLSFVALDSGPTLPFPANNFAAILSVNTLEHVARPALSLKELVRVLEPGGLLVMTFPNLLSPLRPLRRFVVRRRRARYGPESGESACDSLRLVLRNLRVLAAVTLTHRPQFRPRQADFANAEQYRRLGYGADYDAVWLTNPSDVAWRLRQLGMEVLAVRGIAGASERSRVINQLRRSLPSHLSSPILLVARHRRSV
ncbi:MAG: class I SAM-dependent methyltransferase [Chloroflexota bacterium]|nr:class I SAM-dependent methyltransferase [Chloroflexota bacterium]